MEMKKKHFQYQSKNPLQIHKQVIFIWYAGSFYFFHIDSIDSQME